MNPVAWLTAKARRCFIESSSLSPVQLVSCGLLIACSTDLQVASSTASLDASLRPARNGASDASSTGGFSVNAPSTADAGAKPAALGFGADAGATRDVAPLPDARDEELREGGGLPKTSEAGAHDSPTEADAAAPIPVEPREPVRPITCPREQPCVNSRNALVLGLSPVALLSDGTVWQWGSEVAAPAGQLITRRVEGLSNVVALSGSKEAHCALKAEGTVWCWGHAYEPALFGPDTPYQGSNGNYGRSEPTQIPGLSDARVIAVGGAHACAMVDGGSVWCWGRGSDGQLGSTELRSSDEPVRVEGLEPVRQIAAASGSTCALTLSDDVFCWGVNWSGQLGDGSELDEGGDSSVVNTTPQAVVGLQGVTDLVSSGSDAYCALGAEPRAACWGQIMGEVQLSSSVPVAMPDWDEAIELAVGERHACALLEGGHVSCVGDNGSKQLGADVPRSTSTPLVAPELEGVAVLAAAEQSTCAVTEDGQLWCWGDNATRQLGASLLDLGVPQPIASEETFTSVAITDAGCAVTTGGRLLCWGDNTDGELGIDPAILTERGLPDEFSELDGVAAVTAAESHRCALMQDATVRCWGRNRNGQLGNPDITENPSWIPRQVEGLANVVQLVAGSEATCAIVADGTVSCWGDNQYGLLGRRLDAGSFSSTPMQVPKLADVVQLTLGVAHACALRQDHSVLCWGKHAHHIPSVAPHIVAPSEVPFLSGVLEVSAFDFKTCGLNSDHTVTCADVDSDQLLQIPDLSDAVHLVGPCALRSGGGMKCWSLTESWTATPPPGSDGYSVQIDVYDGPDLGPTSFVDVRGCAVTTPEASVVCWGSNGRCQRGTGECPFSATPILIHFQP